MLLVCEERKAVEIHSGLIEPVPQG